VTALAAGYTHTCALTSGGGVVCWGRGDSGQLGDGTRTDSAVPVAVTGLSSGVVAVAGAVYDTCAVTSGGAVQCWGQTDPSGRFGDAATTYTAPVAVTGLSSGVVAVAAGFAHTCALTSGGGVVCWGANSAGDLGDGTWSDSAVPVAVTGLSSGVVAVTTGDSHSCALTSGGDVLCWGLNNGSQLGDGTTTNSAVPVAVTGLSPGVVAIATGNNYSCAVTRWTTVACWGNAGPVPVGVLGTSGVVSVAVGFSHSCALMSDGGVECWGANYYGQLGDGTTTDSDMPVAVTGLSSGVVAIAAGGDHTCALTAAGSVQCWGANDSGQLGDDSTANSLVPVAVIDP
jgi:alpha-tubulin suppressor-like RCC1 family protein